MSKSVDRRVALQMDESDIDWDIRRDDPYRYHAVLTHKATGMVIEQVSDCSKAEAKTFCLKELKWRFKNWEEYNHRSGSKVYRASQDELKKFEVL